MDGPSKNQASMEGNSADRDDGVGVRFDAEQLGFDPDAVDYHEIARRGDLPVMETFLQAGLDPDLQDTRGYSLLMIAAYNGQRTMTELLLERGADPNLPDPSGNSPLMGVCFKAEPEVARILLDHGGDTTARNAAGQTALMFAAMFAQDAIVEALLEYGADPGARDPAGATAADVALQHGHASLHHSLRSALERRVRGPS